MRFKEGDIVTCIIDTKDYDRPETSPKIWGITKGHQYVIDSVRKANGMAFIKLVDVPDQSCGFFPLRFVHYKKTNEQRIKERREQCQSATSSR